MSFSFTVKRKSYSITATYSNGILTGNHYLVARLLSEVNYLEAEKHAFAGYNYSPKGKYINDPMAVKLTAEMIFPDITFHGDIPKMKPLPDGAV